MTLEEAVQILNDCRHRDCSEWHISPGDRDDGLVFGKDQYDWLSPFEAIAIAEKYVRFHAGAWTRWIWLRSALDCGSKED